MAKKEPEGKMTYKSPSTGEYISSTQYIAELAVKRQAEKEKTSLPYKYWNGSSKWRKIYLSQVTQAAKLVKQYGVRAVINGMMSIKWCYSLRTKKLIDQIKIEKKTLDEKAKQQQKNKVEVSEDTTSFRTNKKKNNILGKDL